MASNIQCSNPECPSRTGKEEACFEIPVTVYGDRSMAIQMHKREEEDFECLHCGSKAEAECPWCAGKEEGPCVCGRDFEEE